MAALGSSQYGASFQPQRKWDGKSRKCQNTHLHQQRPSFGVCLAYTFQAPGTVLHLPVAAGIQEENLLCAQAVRGAAHAL